MTAVTFTPGTLGHEATAYAARGIKIFPLWHTLIDGGRAMCACSDGPDCGSPGKHPRTRRGLTEATADVGIVHTWWDRWPQANIGLPAGGNGLGIIDVDPGKGGDETLLTLASYCDERGVDLMATRLVRTGSGGLHLYFRDPLGVVKTSRATFGAPGVDTRGRGGYVVAPPSVHLSGQRYTYLPDSPLAAPWPDILTPLLEPPPPEVHHVDNGVVAAPRGRQGWASAGLLAECDALRAMTRPDSGRNDQLNHAAYKMGRRVGAGMLDEAEVRSALFYAASGWIGHGHTDRSISATIDSGLTAGKAKPHDGPTTRGQK